jgi:hypothetical protein
MQEGGTAVLARKARPDTAKRSSYEPRVLKHGMVKKTRSLRNNLQKPGVLKYKHFLRIILAQGVPEY